MADVNSVTSKVRAQSGPVVPAADKIEVRSTGPVSNVKVANAVDSLQPKVAVEQPVVIVSKTTISVEEKTQSLSIGQALAFIPGVLWYGFTKIPKLVFDIIPRALHRFVLKPAWQVLKFVDNKILSPIAEKLIVPLFEKVVIPAVKWTWNNVLKEPTKFVWNKAVVPGAKLAWRGVKFAWNNAVVPTWRGAVKPTLKFVDKYALTPAWDHVVYPVGKFVFVTSPKYVYNKVLEPVLGPVVRWAKPGFQAAGRVVASVAKSVGEVASSIRKRFG